MPGDTLAVSYHCWNADQKLCAISDNDEVVTVMDTPDRDPKKWTVKAVLGEHSGFVSCIDWNPKSNLIVTCGHDRNAYVWKEEKDDEWKPTLVILRINRAATAVKWSPNGDKFAVASGAKCVPICYYEDSNHWWISKMIKKHKSTVLSLAWCPNNKLLVTGSSDYKCRIVSAFVDGLDQDEPEPFGSLWSNQNKFGECLVEFDQAKAWVNSVAWSPSGFRLAFAGHGSTLHFIQITADGPVVTTLMDKGLPYNDIAFVDDNTLVGAGWDMNPKVFKASGDASAPEWAFSAKLDPETKEKKSSTKAMSIFQAADSRGHGVGSSQQATNLTRHQNLISNIQLLGNGEISTSCLSGKVFFWKV